MHPRTLKVTINGTGFAGDYTACVYGMIPHKNGITIELAGVTSGRRDNAERFAQKHAVTRAFESHAEMLRAVQPDIDNIACANFAHGPYAIEAARAGNGSWTPVTGQFLLIGPSSDTLGLGVISAVAAPARKTALGMSAAAPTTNVSNIPRTARVNTSW